MSRFEELKRLDKKTRNKVRAILSDGDVNAIINLTSLRKKLSKNQSEALDAVLNSPFLGKAARTSTPFPKNPPFADTLQIRSEVSLDKILSSIEENVAKYKTQLKQISDSLHYIDTEYALGKIESCLEIITDTIENNGWSHALLRRIILVRENLPDGQENDKIEALVQLANIKLVVVASLIHSYSPDKNILTVKRSILNLADRGAINRYSRAISRLAVQPFARCKEDLASFLAEVERCSLIDAIILAKFNSHLFSLEDYPAIHEITNHLGSVELFEKLVSTYDITDQESEYAFFKQR